MTWFKVDDGLVDHPKILRLQGHRGWQGALALWTLAGAWSSRHLTDGLVPEAMVQRLGCNKRDAAMLVDVGLWFRADGGYTFHQWTERNPTRKEIEEKREKTRSKVADWRSNQRNLVTGAEVTQGRNPAPVPTRPVPTRPDQIIERGEASPTPSAGSPAAPLDVSESKPRGQSLAAAALQEALRSRLGADAPELSLSLGRQAGRRVAAHARESGGTLDASAALLAASWIAIGNNNALKLNDIPFRAENVTRSRPLQRAKGTTAADFADAPDALEQWERGRTGTAAP